MKIIKTVDAVGKVLSHDITQIIPHKFKGPIFKKGHIIKKEDIPILLSVGKESLYVLDYSQDMLHENDAAEILKNICINEHMSATNVSEGKIEIISDIDGLFLVDVERLKSFNSFGEMMIATRRSGFVVHKGDKLAAMRIIPLIIEKQKMLDVQKLMGDKPLLKVIPLKAKTYSIITTGSEVFNHLIEDSFSPVIIKKMKEYGCILKDHVISGDDPNTITEYINAFLDSGVDIVFCTGGMSVDPDDQTPLAIKNANTNIISYGSPVLPGAMFLISYTKDGRPVIGLPGCVMYAKRTIFDICLPYFLSDTSITKDFLSSLGHGGLCLSCSVCTYPNCGFGKGGY